MSTVELTLRAVLVVAAALVATGVYGALSQQSIVMIMMGLELVVNGLILAAGGIWWAVVPGSADPSVLIVLLVTVMAVEMATGFAVALAIYRARRVELTDDATELAG